MVRNKERAIECVKRWIGHYSFKLFQDKTATFHLAKSYVKPDHDKIKVRFSKPVLKPKKSKVRSDDTDHTSEANNSSNRIELGTIGSQVTPSDQYDSQRISIDALKLQIPVLNEPEFSRQE